MCMCIKVDKFEENCDYILYKVTPRYAVSVELLKLYDCKFMKCVEKHT